MLPKSNDGLFSLRSVARITSVLAVGLMLLVQSAPAWSGVSQISVGAATAHPFSPADTVLNHPPAFGGQVWFEGPAFLTRFVELNVGMDYFPFKLRNVSGANGIQINLNALNFFGGFTVWGAPSVLGIRPFFSTGLGGYYDFLTLPEASGVANNAALNFSLRESAGFDLPLMSGLGFMVEMPLTIVFQNTTLAIWQASFSLRWKL